SHHRREPREGEAPLDRASYFARRARRGATRPRIVGRAGDHRGDRTAAGATSRESQGAPAERREHRQPSFPLGATALLWAARDDQPLLDGPRDEAVVSTRDLE